MFSYYSRLFFSVLFIISLQACGGGSSSEQKDTQESTTQQTITNENYIDLAQYYFQHQTTLIQVSTQSDTLDTYKERSIPGDVTQQSNSDTFTVTATTPFNESVEHLEIAHAQMKIVLDVVRNMYVTIKLYKSDTLVTQTQKTLDAFVNDGRLMTVGDDA